MPESSEKFHFHIQDFQLWGALNDAKGSYRRYWTVEHTAEPSELWENFRTVPVLGDFIGALKTCKELGKNRKSSEHGRKFQNAEKISKS